MKLRRMVSLARKKSVVPIPATFPGIVFLFILVIIFNYESRAQVGPPERGFVSSKPATGWEQALVSGNGVFGALVFGKPADETIILNHARLYMPLNEPLPPVHTGQFLSEIRSLLAAGKYQQAADFVVALSKKEGYSAKRWTDPFIPAFNIQIQTEVHGQIKNYSRSVDFSDGVAAVNWSDTLGSYCRKLFVSRADGVVVLSVTGDQKGSISLKVRLAQQPPKGSGGWNPEKMAREGIREYKTGAGNGWLTYRSSFVRQWQGSLQGYEGLTRVVTKGGIARAEGDCIRITGADEVLLLTKIEVLNNYEKSNIDSLKSVLRKINPDYDRLLSEHKKIHGAIFNRTRLDLGGGAERNLTSEELIEKSKSGVIVPVLIEKQYDAGRYNILCSSGELFPNLQGIWGGTYGPPWSGDFTLNGNVESAIAADLPGNMAECLLPFFRFMEDHREEFRLNAKNLFGCRGIQIPSRASTHGLNNHFDETWPMTFWTAGAGWVSQFFFDYWQYTGDVDFLRKRAFPFMKEAALFYEDFLEEDETGKFVFSPGYSPENNPGNSRSQACFNAAMDIGVARELLYNCIEACRILKTGKDDTVRWKTMLRKMPPYLIDEKGALKEWCTPLLENNDAHRHSSHLYALYNGMPGEIESDPELKKAFAVAFENRLELRRREFRGENPLGRPPGEMAFGIVQQGLTAATLHKADACCEILAWLSDRYWRSNLMTTHNPQAIFNTDLSGGFPALLIRMLVDSKPGLIELLPAWSGKLPDGKIRGIALRGQLLLEELAWQGKVVSATLNSKVSRNVRITTPGEIADISGNSRLLTREGNYADIYISANKTIKIIFTLK